MKLDTVVFDLDGTVADTINLTIHAIKEFVGSHSDKKLTEHEVRSMFGPVDTDIIRRLINSDFDDTLIKEYIEFFSDCFNEFVKPIEGIKELLEFIKHSGMKLGLFTGRSRYTAVIILEKLGLSGVFDEVLCGEDTVAYKPDPDGINKILAKLDSKPLQSAYIGDTREDVKASRNAGTMAFLAQWTSTSYKDAAKINPDAVFKTPYECIEWLKDRV